MVHHEPFLGSPNKQNSPLVENDFILYSSYKKLKE